MKKSLVFVCASVLALAACSEANDQPGGSVDLAEPAAETVEAAPPSAADTGAPNAQAPSAEPTGPAAIPASMPKLAYVFGMSFALPSDDVGKLMRRHANLCEQQGPQSCRIIVMNMTGDAEEGDAYGTLQLAVAANHARAVSALLEDEASDIGAKQTATNIGSEEVSKSIVDTEARIHSREELRDRLTEVLRTRKGSVEELVEAERNVAAVNEEIDQAKSWLAETKGRVAFSRMDIEYSSDVPTGGTVTGPIKNALDAFGSIFGTVIAWLIMLLAVALPIGGVVAGLAWLRRRFTAPAVAP